ncbi:MAG: VWA domain-containing protein, partial [Stellaceae bacterium]
MDGATPSPAGGNLVANIMYFARTLRAAGLPVGPGRVLQAVEAVRAVGLESRGDFYWTLHAVFVNRRDQRLIFDKAFHVFWRNPKLLERMMGLLLPELQVPRPDGAEMSRRLAEALRAGQTGGTGRPREDKTEFDGAMTFSPRDVLQTMDFEKMSTEEMSAARDAVKKLALALAERPTRRFATDPRGARVDMRATLRAQLRDGG